MIKLLIFDFDGVVADLKELHFKALNVALSKIGTQFIISKEEHISIFDGLGTKTKLSLLVDLKKLPLSSIDDIYNNKQQATIDLIPSYLQNNEQLITLLSKLKRDYKIYMASNSIRQTVELGLEKIGILNLFDSVYSSQDVNIPKPHPEIYLRCMIEAGVKPHETMIIEDSKIGRQGALESKAFVCGVDNVSDVTFNKIKYHINLYNSIIPKQKWIAKDTTVLIPMAGAGSRFAQAGYKLPKPLINVNGKPMIQRVVENLNIDANYVFVVQEDHFNQYQLGLLLPLIAPGCHIIKTNGLTEGAACTTLLTKEFIDNDNHLIIANSDQIVEWDSCEFMYDMIYNDYDGGILTFQATDPKWSYARLNDNFVCEVAEKKLISTNATVGIYYWKRGHDYVNFAEQMIKKDIRVNNEFYVCPVFNEAIIANKKIKTFEIDKMWGLGTPEDLKYFLRK